MKQRITRITSLVLAALLALLTVGCGNNATARVSKTAQWISGDQICFLIHVTKVPAGKTTYVSFQLGTGAEVRSFHTFDLKNGDYQICLDLPRSDAANPAYTIYGYVGDTTKPRPYAPPSDPNGADKKAWDKHVKEDWDRENLVDGGTKDKIGSTAPTLPAGTVVNPPEVP